MTPAQKAARDTIGAFIGLVLFMYGCLYYPFAVAALVIGIILVIAFYVFYNDRRYNYEIEKNYKDDVIEYDGKLFKRKRP